MNGSIAGSVTKSCPFYCLINPCTGHVSPQFHTKHDDFFNTVTGKVTHFGNPTPEWMYLTNL